MTMPLPFDQELVQWLTGRPELEGIPASTLTPADRPDRFITVERTGVEYATDGIDRPSLAIQFWAPTMTEAAQLAQLLSLRVLPAVYDLPDVGRFSVDSVYDYPLDERSPRYQITASAVVHTAYSKQAEDSSKE